jgi:hypothetical protein
MKNNFSFISFSYLYNLIKVNYLLIILSISFGSITGFFYYKFYPSKFEAICTFVVEEKSNAGGGGLNSLVSQLGFDVGGVSGSGLLSGDNILDIIKSRSIISEVLLSKIDSSDSKSKRLIHLKNIGGFFGFGKSYISDTIFKSDRAFSLNEQKLLSGLHEGIVKTDLTIERISRRGTIMRVKFNSENEQFTKLFCERLVTQAQQFYIDTKTRAMRTNVFVLQKRSDSLFTVLNSKSYRTADMQVVDANSALKTLSVPLDIEKRNGIIISTMYTEVTRNLEAGKMALAYQMPVIQMLDLPVFPLKFEKPKWYISILTGAILAFIASIVSLIRIDYKKITKAYKLNS